MIEHKKRYVIVRSTVDSFFIYDTKQTRDLDGVPTIIYQLDYNRTILPCVSYHSFLPRDVKIFETDILEEALDVLKNEAFYLAL